MQEEDELVWWLREGATPHFPILPESHSRGWLLRDCGGRILRPADWVVLRARVDAFYEAVERGDVELVPLADEDEAAGPVAECSAPRRRNPGWIYLLQGESGHHKIGRARDVSARVTQLATQAPYAVELVHRFECEDASAAERALHKRFDAQRVVGEWFDLSPAEVQWVRGISTWPPGDEE